MKLQKRLFAAAVVMVSMLASALTFAQTWAEPATKKGPPLAKVFSAHIRLSNLTMTTGACPGFTCTSGNCVCYQAFGDRVMVKPFGLSDVDLLLNVNKASTIDTGVGGTVFPSEGSATIIPKGQTQNLMNLVFGGFNLCETQQGILLGKLGAALAGGAGSNQAVEGIGDLALLISTIEDHIDMELDGNFHPSGFIPPPAVRK